MTAARRPTTASTRLNLVEPNCFANNAQHYQTTQATQFLLVELYSAGSTVQDPQCRLRSADSTVQTHTAKGEEETCTIISDCSET